MFCYLLENADEEEGGEDEEEEEEENASNKYGKQFEKLDVWGRGNRLQLFRFPRKSIILFTTGSQSGFSSGEECKHLLREENWLDEIPKMHFAYYTYMCYYCIYVLQLYIIKGNTFKKTLKMHAHNGKCQFDSKRGRRKNTEDQKESKKWKIKNQ